MPPRILTQYGTSGDPKEDALFWMMAIEQAVKLFGQYMTLADIREAVDEMITAAGSVKAVKGTLDKTVAGTVGFVGRIEQQGDLKAELADFPQAVDRMQTDLRALVRVVEGLHDSVFTPLKEGLIPGATAKDSGSSVEVRIDKDEDPEISAKAQRLLGSSNVMRALNHNLLAGMTGEVYTLKEDGGSVTQRYNVDVFGSFKNVGQLARDRLVFGRAPNPDDK
ncbi:MAG: hypothetical protein EB060_09330 [Proteobacteria bacterium]|nr:hypothetical protein [Pseudomonadota bacterium]